MSGQAQQQVPEGYKQTEVGIIPGDWNMVSYDENFSIISGVGFNKSEYSQSGLKLLRIDNVSYGVITWDSIAYLPKSYSNRYESLILKRKDILLALNRPITNGKLKMAFVKDDDLPSILYQRVGKIIFLNDRVDKVYAFYILTKFIKQFVEQTAVGTDQPFISTTKLKKCKIPIPSDSGEQTAIANTLSDVDALITSLEKLIAKKRAIKTAAMQQLLTGKKRLPPFDQAHTGYKQTELGEIPEDWSVYQFGACVKRFQLGGNYKNDGGNSGIPLIKMGNITRGHISLRKIDYIPKGQIVSEKDRCRYDDIYFNTRNTLDLVGKVSIWSDELPKAYFNSNLMRITFKEECISSNRYMNYLMNSKYFVDALADIAIGTTSVAAIYNRDLTGLKIILPKPDEQTALAEVLSSMDGEINKLERRLNKTQQLKQGMMQELLTGKTRLV